MAKDEKGQGMRVWLCVARLRYGRIMREDRTGQGYCQPDGRHSADPHVPFALPATSKLLENPLSLYAYTGPLSPSWDLTHACFPRESRDPRYMRKYFNRPLGVSFFLPDFALGWILNQLETGWFLLFIFPSRSLSLDSRQTIAFAKLLLVELGPLEIFDIPRSFWIEY